MAQHTKEQLPTFYPQSFERQCFVRSKSLDGYEHIVAFLGKIDDELVWSSVPNNHSNRAKVIRCTSNDDEFVYADEVHKGFQPLTGPRKHKILVGGSYGFCCIWTKEQKDFLRKHDVNPSDNFRIPDHPVYLEMFNKFADERGIMFLDYDSEYRNHRPYIVLEEFEGDLYFVDNYDGAEGVKTPKDFNFKQIK